MFNKRADKQFAKLFRIFLGTMEFTLNVAIDTESPVAPQKLKEALAAIKIFEATLKASKSLFTTNEPLYRAILHFLELLTKNLAEAAQGKPVSPMTKEFSAMHTLTNHASPLETTPQCLACCVCTDQKK